MSRSVARLSLALLCASALAHALAVSAVGSLSLRGVLGENAGDFPATYVAAWVGLPAIAFQIAALIAGVVARHQHARRYLIALPLIGLALIVRQANDPAVAWLSIAGIVALEAGFATAVGLAVVPQLAAASRASLPEALSALAMALALGTGLGFRVAREAGDSATTWIMLAFAAAAGAAIGVRVPAATAATVKSLLRAAQDVVRQPRANAAFLGLVVWTFVVVTVGLAIVRIEAVGDEAIPWLFAGVFGGIAVAGLFRHPYRHGWLIPQAAMTAAICGLSLGDGARWPIVGLGIALGGSLAPLVNQFLNWTRPELRGPAVGLLLAGAGIGAWGFVVLGLMTTDENRGTIATALWIVLIIAAVASGIAFFRPLLEGFVEILLAPIYRIRSIGPGVEQLPNRGPCLVIANHSAWFDPMFLAKVLPAPIVPMMTSKFYDLPIISWLMRNVVGTIRVPDGTVRHEAPELKEAVAALDRGECVILFPEGYLRRKEEQPLRRFGRGVWGILKERPDTIVFPCWIEGNWGSYMSFKGGPPTKNKRMDFWRPIRIGVGEAVRVPAEVLTDHMATRTFLMKKVSEARVPLGLEPIPILTADEGDKE